MIQIDDLVYVQMEYNLLKLKVVGVGPKYLKVKHPNGFISRVSRTKVALPTEEVAVVWETWKSTNGGYRLERELYPRVSPTC